MGNEVSHDSETQILPVPAPREKQKGNIKYEIAVETGTTQGAETDAEVYIQLHGTKNVTKNIKLTKHKLLGYNFEKGHKDRFNTYQFDLGELWMVSVWKQDKGSHADWFLNTIVVKNKETNQEWVFNAYRWVNEREELREATSILPQKETIKDAIQQRQDKLEKKRGEYQWQFISGFPSAIKAPYIHLPMDERWTDEKRHDFISTRNSIIKEVLLDKVLKTFRTWSDFNDFLDLFTVLPVPHVQKTWQQDETFGKMRLEGASLTHFSRCERLPDNFHVTTEDVKKQLRPGTTLEGEMAEHRVYIMNFSELEGLPTQEGRYFTPAMCLLYLNGKGKLVPIAAQLWQEPTNPEWNPVWTPNDAEEDWLYAKMWVGNADLILHEVHTHLLACHLVMEPMIVATNRQLSSVHPVYKLLKPHFRFHLAINSLARSTLLAPEGAVVETSPLQYQSLLILAQRTFKTWRFDRSSLPKLLHDRGIDDALHLPGYHYRDDGLMLSEAIESFVRDVIGIFYKNNDDVVQDFELQNWAQEIVVKGYCNEDKGFPDHIENIDQLTDVVATIIYTCSVQHAAVNFSQYETFAYTPMSPASFFSPPPGYNKQPVKKGQLKMHDIWKALPSKDISARQIGILKLLSSYSDSDERLGSYPPPWFVETDVHQALERYRNRLAAITKVIQTRGEWTLLLPRNIPNSTAN